MGFESQDKMFPYQQKVLVNAIPFQWFIFIANYTVAVSSVIEKRKWEAKDFLISFLEYKVFL